MKKFIIILLLISSICNATNFYMSYPDGDDGNDGLSFDSPFLTVTAARTSMGVGEDTIFVRVTEDTYFKEKCIFYTSDTINIIGINDAFGMPHWYPNPGCIEFDINDNYNGVIIKNIQFGDTRLTNSYSSSNVWIYFKSSYFQGKCLVENNKFVATTGAYGIYFSYPDANNREILVQNNVFYNTNLRLYQNAAYGDSIIFRNNSFLNKGYGNNTIDVYNGAVRSGYNEVTNNNIINPVCGIYIGTNDISSTYLISNNNIYNSSATDTSGVANIDYGVIIDEYPYYIQPIEGSNFFGGEYFSLDTPDTFKTGGYYGDEIGITIDAQNIMLLGENTTDRTYIESQTNPGGDTPQDIDFLKPTSTILNDIIKFYGINYTNNSNLIIQLQNQGLNITSLHSLIYYMKINTLD